MSTPPRTPEEKWSILKSKLRGERKHNRWLARELAARETKLRVALLQIDKLVALVEKQEFFE